MLYVVTAEEMRALDAATIDDLGLPGAILMENAGRRVAEVVLRELAGRQPHRPSRDPEAASKRMRVAVVCGAGNNGGDGYVIARYLRDHGVSAAVYLCAPAERVRGDARLHLDAYRAMGHPVHEIADTDALAAHAAAIESADAAVDGIFGTGLARPIGGHYRAVVETVNRCRGVRVAIDIPSGLSADTGEELGVAVAADVTVTMAFLKVGLAIAPGFARAGRVEVAEIGIPVGLAGQRDVRTVMTEAADLRAIAPTAAPLQHKNRRGHLLVVAGSSGKRGAARLTAWAGLRAGAGLVTLASSWHGAEPAVPDPIMTAELTPDASASQSTGDEGPGLRLLEVARGKRALAMGPGMVTGPDGRALVYRALAEISLPMVLDADALNHLGTDLAAISQARAPVVITPHPGEAARLLGTTSRDVERDRLRAVRELATRSGAVVVLKGARSLVCSGRDNSSPGYVAINPTGNPALATAGSGDVLTGIIGAFLAQGLAPLDAARLGVFVHGRTGERAAREFGNSIGPTAADLSQHVPAIIAELQPVASRNE